MLRPGPTVDPLGGGVARGSGGWHSAAIASAPPARTEVRCELGFAVADHARLALQVAVAAGTGDRAYEHLAVLLDGVPVPVEEVAVDHGGRVHLLEVGAGHLTVTYAADLVPAAARPAGIGDAEALVALRQSRYAPADRLERWAAEELAHLPRGDGLGAAVAHWVHDHLAYELGSSGPFDTAIDTLLARRGVCRDFAHLTLAAARALGVPARMTSAYAPGLSPMDFHAVVEVAGPDGWEVVDPTRLAPRSSLVRIATGRDAADTAFATTLAGSVELTAISVAAAAVPGPLPVDDHRQRVLLA